MKNRVSVFIVIATVIMMIPVLALAQIVGFTQDFESFDASNPDALGNAGWLVYGNVFEAGSGDWLYGYGAFPAPNNPAAPAFSNIVIGEGGVEQGAQQLSIFSDYENAGAHTAGNIINANIFKEFSVSESDVGKVWTFGYESKLGNLEAPTTAMVFIKTIDPANNWAMTNLVSEDMTNITTDWTGGSVSLLIDAGLVGQFFQVGFSNDCTSYDSSSIIYDNLSLTDEGGEPFGMNPYEQDFESLDMASTSALGDDGWLVFGNVFSGTSGELLYGYGPNPAPNNPSAPAFSNIVSGEGGAEQGVQQISVFSDYENSAAHVAGDVIEANVYREQIVGPLDIGKTWIFEFQAKMPFMGGVTPPSTALAFIKTLDPGNDYEITNFISEDMTSISGDWAGWTLSLTIDENLVGQYFQFGFSNSATSYASSAVVYDNVVLVESDVSDVPDGAGFIGATLRQNYPNPFNPMTRIDFTLEKSEFVNLVVYDIAGRQVINLVNSDMTAGDHFVTWDGMTYSGTAAPSGQYYYVMKTGSGQISRSMILLK
ncbi:MAG: T9SS type A sorting domain-containing protein [bacterium]|nr:T9SS type A sorting domain-containing protein [bacterium]MCP4799120.1 T9SS type A sorting domain-containing protein [bacterium]